MNKNLDRIKHGWQPRADAHGFWWMLHDMIVLKYIVKAAIRRKFKASTI